MSNEPIQIRVTPAPWRSGERLPDGVYDGIWGGYRVTLNVGGIQYEAQTQDGIRTPRAECKVTSKDGMLLVEVVSV